MTLPYITRFLTVVSLFIGTVSPAQTPAATVPKQAETIRSTTGRMLNEQGIADKPIPVRKGFVFDVVEESLADVTLVHEGRKFKLAKSDVRISEKGVAPTPTAGGFTPGQIVLISAKYTVVGNQPRNVKNRLSKLIPTGIITEPVSIQVTDELSSMASNQGNTDTSVIFNGDNTIVTTTATPRNVLTVEYSFNGQVRKKQALEGSFLALP